MTVVIGTSGYSYEDWRNVFYPPNLPKNKMLDFYVDHFNSVEINSSYYAVPHPSVFQRFNEKTPPGFEFIVKLNKANTHERKESARALEGLVTGIQPLVDNQKFSGFLGQFPYSFKNIPGNRDYLVQLKSQLGSLPLFVEFRNWSWDRPEIYQLLEKHAIHYVNVDEPPLRGLLKPQDKVTAKMGYVRFHGRNTLNWWKGNNQTRYDYLYTRSELDDWLIGLSRIIKKSYKTYIFFNNHPQGKAIQNANMLKELLDTYLPGL